MSEIRAVGVLGAGTMGNGIAHVFARSGFEVQLCEVEQRFLDRGMETIGKNLDREVAKQKLTREEAASALKRIQGTLDRTSLERCDFVIEAATEKFEIKAEIFPDLDRLTRPEIILASNTSSISITKLAAVTKRPEKVIGMHFFNPVPKMKLIELVRTPHTSDETVATCREAARRMGKEVVIVNEAPGFITTRVNALIGNEAFNMLEAGIASAEDIDKALKLGLNHPMGPFELVDLVGLDVRLKILEYLHQTLGEKYRPNSLLRQYVKEGRLGRKSGRGVYDYAHEKAAEKKA